MGSQERCRLLPIIPGREWRGRQPGHEPGSPETLYLAFPRRLKEGARLVGGPFSGRVECFLATTGVWDKHHVGLW